MNSRIHHSRVATKTSALIASLAACAALLSGCYVVPINQGPYPTYPAAHQVTGVPAQDFPLNITARLYPANEAATPYGLLTANVTNQLNGKGQFTVNVAGETLQGEATRTAGSARNGTASAAGPRGTFMQCTYTMNNASMGTGNCRLNNGAQFSMHVGG